MLEILYLGLCDFKWAAGPELVRTRIRDQQKEKYIDVCGSCFFLGNQTDIYGSEMDLLLMEPIAFTSDR